MVGANGVDMSAGVQILPVEDRLGGSGGRTHDVRLCYATRSGIGLAHRNAKPLGHDFDKFAAAPGVAAVNNCPLQLPDRGDRSNCVFACPPEPMIPATLALARAKYFVATPEAAPVLCCPRKSASIMANNSPVVAE